MLMFLRFVFFLPLSLKTLFFLLGGQERWSLSWSWCVTMCIPDIHERHYPLLNRDMEHPAFVDHVAWFAVRFPYRFSS